jgi:uncharacterized protein (TIRG00374 family)
MPQVRQPDPGPSPPRRGPGNRLGWAVAAAVLASCLLLVRPADIATALARVSPVELAILLTLATLDRVLMGLKWGLLLHLVDVRLSFARAVRIFYKASFAGTLLPIQVGGDLLRAYWAVQAGGTGYPVAASLVMERLLGLLSAANWALAGAVVLVTRLAPDHVRPLVGGGLLAVLAADVLFVLSLSERMHGHMQRRLGRLGGSRLGGMLQRFHAAWALYGRDRRGLLLAAVLTLAEHGVQLLVVLAIAWSIDVTAYSVPLLAAAALFLLLARLPLAPDGWGVAELTAIGVFGLAGVAAADAFSLSLIGHVVPLLALAPGLVLLLVGREWLPEGAHGTTSIAGPAP